MENTENKPAMATFLLKTEPGTYSYDDLAREKKTTWDGVSNPAALAQMRQAKKGDLAFIYHTGDERAIVGLAEIASDPRPDPKAQSEKVVVFDLKPKKRAARPVTLAEIKADARFKDFALVRQGRLSAMLTPAPLAKILREMAGL